MMLRPAPSLPEWLKSKGCMRLLTLSVHAQKSMICSYLGTETI